MKATLLLAAMTLFASPVNADPGGSDAGLKRLMQTQSDTLEQYIERKLGDLMRQPMPELRSRTDNSLDSTLSARNAAAGQPLRLAWVPAL
jgi:hypothetical protein